MSPFFFPSLSKEWNERNSKIFEREEEILAMWDRVWFLASMWASVTTAFKGFPLWLFQHNWGEFRDRELFPTP